MPETRWAAWLVLFAAFIAFAFVVHALLESLIEWWEARRANCLAEQASVAAKQNSPWWEDRLRPCRWGDCPMKAIPHQVMEHDKYIVPLTGYLPDDYDDD